MISFNHLSLLIMNTIQKEIRNKTILFLFVFTLIVIFMSYSLVNLFFQQVAQEDMLSGLGLGMSSIFISVLGAWTSLVALLVGANVLRSDMDEKVLPQILALPVTRTEYLLSRLIGSWLIVMVFYLLSASMITILFQFVSRDFANFQYFIISIGPLSVSVFVVIWVSMFFSQYFPKIFALLTTTFALGFIQFSNTYFLRNEVSKVFAEGNILGMILSVFYFIFPRTGEWARVNSAWANNTEITFSLPELMIHTAVSSLIIFILSAWVFKKRDF